MRIVASGAFRQLINRYDVRCTFINNPLTFIENINILPWRYIPFLTYIYSTSQTNARLNFFQSQRVQYVSSCFFSRANLNNIFIWSYILCFMYNGQTWCIFLKNLMFNQMLHVHGFFSFMNLIKVPLDKIWNKTKP